MTHSDELVVSYAKSEQTRPGVRYGPVIRETYIFECCTQGQGSVIINGSEFPFSAGQCYVLLPGDTVTHTSDHQLPRGGFWCSLKGSAIGPLLKAAGISSSSPFLPNELYHELCRWLSQLAHQWECDDAGARFRQLSCAYGLLGAILQNRPEAKKSSFVDKAIGLMEINYPDMLNVTVLAREVGLDRSYFSRLFKEKTGLSPHQYLTRLRIEKACRLLDTRQHGISEVSCLVGLDPHNFSRLFKNELGITPREYLQS